MDNINSSKTFPQYKTLVDEYWSSDVSWDRSTFVTYNINGRIWWKHGQRPSVTYFAKIYKVQISDKFDTSRQYVMQIGMARQSTKELQVSKQEGIEIAAEHAVTEPIAIMYFEKKPMRKDFLRLVNVFRDLTNDNRVVMTREELNNAKDINDGYKAFLEEIHNYKDENCCDKQKCKKDPLTEDEAKKESNVTSTSDKGVDCWIGQKFENKKSPFKYSECDVTSSKSKKAENTCDCGSNKEQKDAKATTTYKIDDDDLANSIADALNTFSSIFGLDIPTRTKEDVEDVELTPEDMKNIDVLRKLFHM